MGNAIFLTLVELWPRHNDFRMPIDRFDMVAGKGDACSPHEHQGLAEEDPFCCQVRRSRTRLGITAPDLDRQSWNLCKLTHICGDHGEPMGNTGGGQPQIMGSNHLARCS